MSKKSVSKRHLKVVAQEKGDINSANGKIVVTGAGGFHKKVHVVYFSENQVEKILNVVDQINKSG